MAVELSDSIKLFCAQRILNHSGFEWIRKGEKEEESKLAREQESKRAREQEREAMREARREISENVNTPHVFTCERYTQLTYPSFPLY
jgi:hypothetical protein